MTKFKLHYMLLCKDKINRHCIITIEAETEEEAYLKFHQLGFYGWYATTI